MARKVVSRKALREEAEAAEAAEKATPKKKKAAPKKKTTRKKKAADAEVRLKAFWGVFSQSMKRVAMGLGSTISPAAALATHSLGLAVMFVSTSMRVGSRGFSRARGPCRAIPPAFCRV